MNTCDEDIEADDKIIAEEGERELYEHFRFVADKGQNLLRVDKFLVARLESSSRNRVQQAAEAGCILVNGKAICKYLYILVEVGQQDVFSEVF